MRLYMYIGIVVRHHRIGRPVVASARYRSAYSAASVPPLHGIGRPGVASVRYIGRPGDAFACYRAER